MRLILASNSETRKAIFDMLGLKYEVITSDEKEISTASDPSEYVKELSRTKANSVAKKIDGSAIIISADTIVYMDGKIYEKPKTLEEAFLSLKEMSGKLTYTYTGMTIKDLYQYNEVTISDACKVYIKEIDDVDIKWYVENEEKILKAAGYSFFGKADLFLEKVDGDYDTMLGISPSIIHTELKKLGYEMKDFELK